MDHVQHGREQRRTADPHPMTIDITPEILRPLLFFTLLTGPVVVWLLYRAAREPSQRTPGSMSARDTGNDWICGICGSLNLANAQRCYKGCSPISTPVAPLTSVANSKPLVAVGPGRPPGPRHPAPVTRAVPARAGAAAVPPKSASRVPSRPAAASPVVLATTAPVLVGGSTSRPGPSGAAMRPGVPALELPPVEQPAERQESIFAAPAPDACPLLGSRRDARTRFMFSDSEHRCYATARPAKIDIQQQDNYCLGAHEECTRFLAHRDVSAIR
jgi:hypothetical protein